MTLHKKPDRFHLPGAQAEQLAATWLQRQGLALITRNYRCRYGEIDIIANHGGTLVFIEVRLRRSATFDRAIASITPHKQQRIIKAAQHYLSHHPTARHRTCRFDCLLLNTLDPEAITYQWMQNAFDG